MKVSRYSVIYIFFLVGAYASSQELTSQAHDREYFEALDDVALQLELDVPEAREVFLERIAGYTREQVEEITAAYHQALLERESRDNPSAEVLLERIAAPDSREQLLYAFLALNNQYKEASAEERASIREGYLAGWRAMTPPEPGKLDQDIDFDQFFGYLNNLHHYFPNEAEVLPILEERCVQSGLDNGVVHMYRTLCFSDAYELGPLTAARAEATYMAVFRTGNPNEFDGDAGILESALHTLLGKCGRSGLEALLRMGTLKTPTGMQALRYMHTPEAEAMLWEILEDPASHPHTKVKVLHMLDGYQYRNPSDERLRRYREPLVGLMALPEDGSKYDMHALEEAVRIAMKTGDAYYRKPIVALERALDPAVLRKTDEVNLQGMDPVQFPLRYSSESLHAAIDEAKDALK